MWTQTTGTTEVSWLSDGKCLSKSLIFVKIIIRIRLRMFYFSTQIYSYKHYQFVRKI